MFGIGVRGHPHLRRILMPPWWEGHPLRKESPSRGTEMGRFEMPPEVFDAVPGGACSSGPRSGACRAPTTTPRSCTSTSARSTAPRTGRCASSSGCATRSIVHCIPDIGYHHRGAEKMGERQTWHTYIPYTDRIDYLGGVINNLPYVLTVEKLCGIEVPERAQVIRVMLCEFFRITSHLVFYGTFAQDIGALSPVFYMFKDRERIFDAVVEAICGARMHPNWFRIGGVAEDLPNGWEQAGARLPRLPAAAPRRVRPPGHGQPHHEGAHRGRGRHQRATTPSSGASPAPTCAPPACPGTCASSAPTRGYEQFEFDVPVGTTGDCYDRAAVRVEEMRQSLRIIRQCLDNMPAGPYKADHPLTTPPLKEPATMHDIETLITHFLGVSWGPVVPPGEACVLHRGRQGPVQLLR